MEDHETLRGRRTPDVANSQTPSSIPEATMATTLGGGNTPEQKARQEKEKGPDEKDQGETGKAISDDKSKQPEKTHEPGIQPAVLPVSNRPAELLGGSNTPEQSPLFEGEKGSGSKCRTNPSEAHLHSHLQVAAFIDLCEATNARKEESKKKKTAEEQSERTNRHKELAIKRKYGVEIKMHPIHPQWCKSEKEHGYTRGVQNFLSKIK